MLPSLLFLTDLSNGSEEEDKLVSDFLRRDYEVTVCHPRDCEPFEDMADAIIIRNVWNEKEYGKPEPWYARWRRKPGLPIHDDLYMRAGGMKDYLLWLYGNGFPVIPSADSLDGINKLPEADAYFIKPKDGFDAIGARKVSRAELAALNPKHCLIQPFVDFEHELSFYYLDKELQYALYAPDKAERWDLQEFTPSQGDIAFAERFIEWNRQRYGIERIDACRLRSGELLLMEITDQGGAYLSVEELSDGTRQAFLENLSASIRKNCLQ